MDSIQIIKSPPTVALLGEGITYQLQRNYESVTGKAQLIITLQSESQAYYPDKYLEIELPTGILRFYFVDTPDQSGLQLSGPELDPDMSVYSPQVAAELNQNYYINKNYIVTVDASYRIVITARVIGSAYDLSFVSTNISGLTQYSNTAGIDDSTDADYKIYAGICLYNPDPAIPTPLGEELIPVSDQEIAYCNLAAYLADQLQSSFHYPFNGTLVYEVPNAVARYFIRYAEYIAGSSQKVYNDAETPHYLVAGGLRKLDSDFLSEDGTCYFNYNDNHKRFLTWAPQAKTTFPSTPERLNFMLYSPDSRLYVTKYYDTGATSPELLYTFTQDLYTIVEIACGLSDIFAGENIDDLIYYEIVIKNSKTQTLSETRTFIVDHSSYLNTRTLVFKNGFGMFDMVHCTGVLKVSDKVSRDEVSALSNSAFRRRVVLAENIQQYEINTGWLPDRTYRQWLEDLLLSTEVYLILGDFLLPLTNTTAKIVNYEDREHNYSMQLSFEPDFNNENYSAIVGEGVSFLVDENYVIYTDENGTRLIE